jgi:hypothetical protein
MPDRRRLRWRRKHLSFKVKDQSQYIKRNGAGIGNVISRAASKVASLGRRAYYATSNAYDRYIKGVIKKPATWKPMPPSVQTPFQATTGSPAWRPNNVFNNKPSGMAYRGTNHDLGLPKTKIPLGKPGSMQAEVEALLGSGIGRKTYHHRRTYRRNPRRNLRPRR